MKAAFVVVALLICGVFADDLYEQFVEWTMKYNKVYNSVEEHVSRFSAFKRNVALVRHLNRNSEGTTFALNKFADLTQEEFAARYLSSIPPSSSKFSQKPAFEYDPSVKYPSYKNWVEEGAVTPVKNQENCGACWAFSTTGALEGAYFLAHKILPSISEQQLLDCDHDCNSYGRCDEGCTGGYMPVSLGYAIRVGMVSEEDYPYKAVDQNCMLNKSKIKYRFSNFTPVSAKEDAMIAALNEKGPLSVAVDASFWSLYKGGIFNGGFTWNLLNHGVLLVGYGEEENGKQYWIIKNSWGADWGEDGYIRLPRGTGRNYCNVQNLVNAAEA